MHATTCVRDISRTRTGLMNIHKYTHTRIVCTYNYSVIELRTHATIKHINQHIKNIKMKINKC